MNECWVNNGILLLNKEIKIKIRSYPSHGAFVWKTYFGLYNQIYGYGRGMNVGWIMVFSVCQIISWWVGTVNGPLMTLLPDALVHFVFVSIRIYMVQIKTYSLSLSLSLSYWMVLEKSLACVECNRSISIKLVTFKMYWILNWMGWVCWVPH